MTLNDTCVCMVDTCWRKGMCQLCIASHGGNAASVSCALDPEAYAARKAKWEHSHDEPSYPENTALGILSRCAQGEVRVAAETLKELQKELNSVKPELETETSERIQKRLGQMLEWLALSVEQCEAALVLAKAEYEMIPAEYR